MCQRSARSGEVAASDGDGAGRAEVGDVGRVLGGVREVALEPERGRRAGEVDVLLDAEGDAGERALRELRAQRAGQRIEARVELVDARAVLVDDLARRYVLRSDRAREGGGTLHRREATGAAPRPRAGHCGYR